MMNGKCSICENRNCRGMEQLREFESWDDLAGHCAEATIVRWVNELAVKKEAMKFQHKKYNERRKQIVRAAQRLLDPDELELIRKQAAAKASGGGDEKK